MAGEKAGKILALVSIPPGGAATGAALWRLLAGHRVIDWITTGLKACSAVDTTAFWPADSHGLAELEAYAGTQGSQVLYSAHDKSLGPLIRLMHRAGYSHVLRVTAPCPLVDPELITAALHTALTRRLDYMSSSPESGLPRGLALDILSLGALQAVASEQLVTDGQRVVCLAPDRALPLLTETYRAGLDPAWSALDAGLTSPSSWDTLAALLASSAAPPARLAALTQPQPQP